MKSTTFKVKTGIQNPSVNKILRCADLADGVFIDNDSGYAITVMWEKGQKVDAAHIEKVKSALRKTCEEFGFCVLGITVGN